MKHLAAIEVISRIFLMTYALHSIWYLNRNFKRLVDHMTSPRIQNTNVLFNPEIVELIRNWRRSPRAKKETV